MQRKRNSLSKHWIGSKAVAFLWLAVVLSCSALLVKQWAFTAHSPIETDILKLLPTDQQNPLAEQAFNKVTANMSDKVVFVLTASEQVKLHQAASEFELQLSQSQYFDKVTGRISEAQQRLWAKYYFEHRFQQLTPEQRTRLASSPQEQVQKVIQSLYNPFSGVTGQELKNDPFLIFRDYLAHISATSSQFQLKDGYLTTEFEGNTYLLITAELKNSPYSLSAQQAVPMIEQLEKQLENQYQVKTAHTGVLFYADFGTRSAKSEISTIGLFSLLGVILLITVVFRSITPLTLALLSISVGLLVALAITTWLFGQVHLFSLVFGASLIGVSIDYAFHYLTDRLAAGNQWHSIKGLKHILAAITLGLVTSLIGYLGLLIAPFPGLQQLALFSAIGLTAAYATVVAWYPILAASPAKARSLPGQTLWQQWFQLWTRPYVRIGLPSTILLLSLAALTQVTYNDDIRQLQAMPSDLKAQEQLISTLSGLQPSQQMIVVSAENNETLMQKLERFDQQLLSWQQDHVISDYQSLSQYIGSEQRQHQDHDLIKTLYSNFARPLAHSLKLATTPKLDADYTPVHLQDYLANPVSEAVRFLYLGQVETTAEPQQVAAVVLLNKVQNPEVIRGVTEKKPDMAYLDKAADISVLFGQYLIKIMELLAIAILVIGALLTKRYGFKHTIRILLPSLIACCVGIAITVVVGSTLNLFNLLALILIIGIGIDYTLFFAEQARSHSTLLAITLSAMTTLLSFGLLALSQTHAIHSFGVTVLSGIFIAWLLSPIAIAAPQETK
ncbi:MMPL family transporter [Vibrio sp. TRT 17S01]|uniref:MMPL family transporter n=1 Tax=Vibrio sp. TRT 17S01 TaxID=3418505 RepID=UPI003CF9FA1D